jgi:hypothetical protein
LRCVSAETFAIPIGPSSHEVLRVPLAAVPIDRRHESFIVKDATSQLLALAVPPCRRPIFAELTRAGIHKADTILKHSSPNRGLIYSPNDGRNVCCNVAADVAVGGLVELLTSLLRGLR